MKPEDFVQDIVLDVTTECLFNDFTAKNKLGAVVEAVTTVKVLGVTGLITVPLALAGGALACIYKTEHIFVKTKEKKRSNYRLTKSNQSSIQRVYAG